MVLWISGELDKEADNDGAFRRALASVEQAFNAHFADRDFGPGLQKLRFIAIIMSGRYGAPLPEIQQYHRRQQIMDARLRLDYQEFVTGDDLKRAAMIASGARRTLELAGKKVPDLDIAGALAHFDTLTVQLHWTSGTASAPPNEELKPTASPSSSVE